MSSLRWIRKKLSSSPLLIEVTTTFFVLLFCVSPCYSQDFTITDFNAAITVNEDSSFTVRETISVDFHRPRHGIYREIPYVYSDSQVDSVKTPTGILSVRDGAGRKIRYKISRTGNLINVRIGDPGEYVTGFQKYEIYYKVENAVLFFEDHDEIYWNVTGNYWKAPIKHAQCSVRLGTEGITKKYQASCYTGRTGSDESSCRFTPYENFIEFSAQRSFSAGEGLTIAYGWDKGLVSPPSAFRKFLWKINLRQNWIYLIPLMSLIAMANLWSSKGRDPRQREAVTVMYGPPEHGNRPLSPAEIGSLVDEKLDPRDITASIVGLAAKGYITIEEKTEDGFIFDSKDYYLSKLKETDDSLTSFERELMSGLFSPGEAGVMVSDLKNSFYKKLEALKNTLYGELMDKKFFSSNPQSVRQLYAGTGVAVGVLLAFFFNFSMGSYLGDFRAITAGILTGLPILGFSRYMPVKTRKGAGVYMDILGFEEFLNRAEKDRLERMKDDHLFSKFLPYAMALDVADNWAKAFEGIYQEPPQWYVSSGGFRTFNTRGFSRSISTAMTSLSSAMYSAPRSSGKGGGFSGGGGSSGGGFGGGGGGSW
jgi:uncharacterized membrane protein YgcG